MVSWRRKAEVEAEPLNLNIILNLNALAEAGVCLALASLAIRVAPAVTLRLAQAGVRPRDQHSGRPAARAWAAAARLWRLTAAVARRLPWRPTCLAQALAVGWMLRRRGIATRLRFGVRVADGALAAHAWLECAGRVVGPPRVAETFAPLEPVSTSSEHINA